MTRFGFLELLYFILGSVQLNAVTVDNVAFSCKNSALLKSPSSLFCGELFS